MGIDSHKSTIDFENVGRDIINVPNNNAVLNFIFVFFVALITLRTKEYCHQVIKKIK